MCSPPPSKLSRSSGWSLETKWSDEVGWGWKGEGDVVPDDSKVVDLQLSNLPTKVFPHFISTFWINGNIYWGVTQSIVILFLFLFFLFFNDYQPCGLPRNGSFVSATIREGYKLVIPALPLFGSARSMLRRDEVVMLNELSDEFTDSQVLNGSQIQIPQSHQFFSRCQETSRNCQFHWL
jgi:hypothetical protein